MLKFAFKILVPLLYVLVRVKCYLHDTTIFLSEDVVRHHATRLGAILTVLDAVV
jgi:hypothetical protein